MVDQKNRKPMLSSKEIASRSYINYLNVAFVFYFINLASLYYSVKSTAAKTERIIQSISAILQENITATSKLVIQMLAQYKKSVVTNTEHFAAGLVDNLDAMAETASNLPEMYFKHKFNSQLCFLKGFFDLPIIKQFFKFVGIPNVSDLIVKAPSMDFPIEVDFQNFQIHFDEFRKALGFDISLPTFALDTPSVPDEIGKIIQNFELYVILVTCFAAIALISFNLFNVWNETGANKKKNLLNEGFQAHPIRIWLSKFLPKRCDKLISYLSHIPAWTCVLVGLFGLLQILLLSKAVHRVNYELEKYMTEASNDMKSQFQNELIPSVKQVMTDFFDKTNAGIQQLEMSVDQELDAIRDKAVEIKKALQKFADFLSNAKNSLNNIPIFGEIQCIQIKCTAESMHVYKYLGKISTGMKILEKLELMDFTLPKIEQFQLENYLEVLVTESFEKSTQTMSLISQCIVELTLQNIQSQQIFYVMVLTLGLLLPTQAILYLLFIYVSTKIKSLFF